MKLYQVTALISCATAVAKPERTCFLHNQNSFLPSILDDIFKNNIPKIHRNSQNVILGPIPTRLREMKLNSWGIGDDWTALSNAENTNRNFDPLDPASYFCNFEQMNEDSEANATFSTDEQFLTETIDFIHQIDGIQSESEYVPPLYDTAKSFDTYTKNIAYMDEAGKEISMLVRCNESPDTLLIEEGRAILPLSDEQRFEVSQLLKSKSVSNMEKDSNSAIEDKYESTSFFDESVSSIFHTHAIQKQISSVETRAVLDSAGISAWMTACLDEIVGKHDKRVNAVIARYGTYGTGYLESFQFHQLYLDAVFAGIAKETRRTNQFGGVNSPLNRLNLEQPDLSSVWRDFKAHGIETLIEREHRLKGEEIEASIGMHIEQTRTNMIMDECEILDWDSNSKGYLKDLTDMDIERSSYESVELASDRKTPKRLRDGSFVFIDEESCIGCMQCVLTAPASFKMLDNGRARTFAQSNNPEVTDAVSVCPVNCMHRLSFDELKEMEHARDNGDGRTDHRHMGRGQTHTPLSVAGIGSDANHKSSWYHYLKSKCFTSKSCPQKGCYDCPLYGKKGDNPHFKTKHREAERTRAQDFIASGEADKYRKTCDL